MIRQEDTDYGMDVAQIYAPIRHGANICLRGEDVAAASVLVRRGERLTTTHLGVLASVGQTNISVFRQAHVAVLCTGDEVVRPGTRLEPGKIYDSNGTVLLARLTELGVHASLLPEVADDADQIAKTLHVALSENDIVLTTGGVSVGKKDVFHQVLPKMGVEQLFWKVAMKPGSPMMAGVLNGKLLICLSGNPFAALSTFELLAVPVLRRLCGEEAVDQRRIRTIFRGSFGKESKTRRFVRAYFDGTCVRVTGLNHSSGSLSTMIGCNCLIDIPAGSGALQDGQETEVILL